MAPDHEQLANPLAQPSGGDEVRRAMSQEGADVVDLFAMIEAIAKMGEEEEAAKAKKWVEMLPLVTPESAARKDANGNVPLHVALCVCVCLCVYVCVCVLLYATLLVGV